MLQRNLDLPVMPEIGAIRAALHWCDQNLLFASEGKSSAAAACQAFIPDVIVGCQQEVRSCQQLLLFCEHPCLKAL